MLSHLERSFPSSNVPGSTASTGTSTPSSGSTNEWLRDTPDTSSPPGSGVASPEVKECPSPNDRGSPIEKPHAGPSCLLPAAKNICFVGAGFVGTAKFDVTSRCEHARLTLSDQAGRPLR